MNDVTFEGLKRELLSKEEDENTKKDLELILALQNGHHEFLSFLDGSLKNNMDFMLPLLYAYKNQYGTFDVYDYCGPSIQENWDVADQVVKLQPALIAKTNLINDPDFIVRHLEAVPELRGYLSNEMLEDPKVKEEIERIDQPDPMIVAGAVSVASVAVASAVSTLGAFNIAGGLYTIEQLENASFIPNIESFTKEDFSFFQELSEDKRDDANYLKDIVAKNIHAFEYIAEHADDFGIEGLDSVKEQVEKDAIEKALKKFEEEKKQKEEELSQNPEDKDAKRRIKQLEDHIELMKKLQNGEEVPMRVVKGLYEVTQDEELKTALKQYMQVSDKVEEKKHDVDYVRRYVGKACDEKPSKKVAYVAEKAETFGRECLEVARDVVVQRTMEDAIKDFKKEIEKIKEKSREEGREATPEEQKKEKQNERHIAYLQELVDTDLVKAVRFARRVYDGCPNLSPEYKAVLSHLIRIDDVALEKAEKEKQQESQKENKQEKQVTSDVRRDEMTEKSADKPYMKESRWTLERASSIGTSELRNAATQLEKTVKTVKEQSEPKTKVITDDMEKG